MGAHPPARWSGDFLQRVVRLDGTQFEAEDVLGRYPMTRRYDERHRKPTMQTETNHFDPDIAPTWLWKQWTNVLGMRKVGMKVPGCTCDSLNAPVHRDSAPAKNDGHVDRRGLYDLDRNERPVAKAYHLLLKAFGRIALVPEGELYEMTDRPPMLKVEV